MIIGVLGGGQLGRMLALSGIPLGLRFRFLDPSADCPAADLGEVVVAEYDDSDALARFARGLHAVTYEFENVPAESARRLAQHAPVHPSERALATAQDRLAEKTCFQSLGIQTPEFAPVDSLDDLRAAIVRIGLPSVLKTRRFGYDGKGQVVLRTTADVDMAWRTLGEPRLRRAARSSSEQAEARADLILEQFVPFARELSILGVRSLDGATRFYPPVENRHSGGILSRSVAPAPESGAADGLLQSAAESVLRALGYVGVLAIEFFEMSDGRLLANEMAPRVHNSGHWSIEGASCSQFENHVRAVAGLPLGSTAPRGQSVMLNIIGAEPDPGVFSIEGVHVHMYGKQPRAGRKLGHLTVCEHRPEDALAKAARAEAMLRNC